MSSLQKFHRRTASFGPPPPWPATSIGGGDETHGYWLGGVSYNKLIVAPKSTEVQREWGSFNTARGTTSTTDGLSNTDTLAVFGNAGYPAVGHPAAYYCKNLTTGGYNTWYLPARDELNTLYSNKSAVPFASANSFGSYNYLSSTEASSSAGGTQNMTTGLIMPDYYGKYQNLYVRAVRRTAI